MSEVVARTVRHVNSFGRNYIRRHAPLYRTAKGTRDLLRRFTYKAGALLMTNDQVRGWMNNAYENRREQFRDAFNTLFDGSHAAKVFLWRVGVAEKHFKVPVYPELNRSWSNARVWGWAGNRSIRLFYEFYLKQRPAGTLLDVGANDGMHTYPFAMQGFDCHCFEPQPSCIDYIKRVVELNSFHNVQPVQAAISDENASQVTFFISESSWYSSMIKESVERFEQPEMISVDALTVDSYCLDHGVKPTLIKIDVEGYERNVLQGSEKAIEEFRPDVFVEVEAEPEHEEKIWDFFRRLGYRLYILKHYTSKPFKPIASLQELKDEERQGVNSDFIFLAETRFRDEFERWIELQGLISHSAVRQFKAKPEKVNS